MSKDRPIHSVIGASSMYRWNACPGSVKLSEGQPNKSSQAAREGTAAHEIVALALTEGFSKNISPYEWLLNTAKHLKVYTDYIESLKKDNPVHIEHSFDMSDIFPSLYGTADCVIYDKTRKVLHVIDYKHGAGIPVEALNNLQGAYYALGALHTLPYPCREVQVTIVQPRCYHPAGPIRHWRMSSLYFIEFELELIAAAKKTQKKKAKLSSGDHCIFCPAKTVCKEYEKRGQQQAKKEFTFYKDPSKDFEVYESPNSNAELFT